MSAILGIGISTLLLGRPVEAILNRAFKARFERVKRVVVATVVLTAPLVIFTSSPDEKERLASIFRRFRIAIPSAHRQKRRIPTSALGIIKV